MTVSIFEDKILPCKIIETAVYIALKTSSFFHAFRKPQFCMHWHFIFQILSYADRRQSFMHNACILSEFKRFHAPQKWFIFLISRNEGRCIISAPPPLWILKCVALESHIVYHTIFIVSIRDQHSEFDLEKYWDVCFFVAQWLEIFCIIPGMVGYNKPRYKSELHIHHSGRCKSLDTQYTKMTI